MTAIIRDGRDEDEAGYIRLIGDAWAEYPNCILDVDGEVPELRALHSYFGKAGGRVWVAEEGGRIVGMVATRPLGSDHAWEICKMYVEKSQRGTGLAHRLLGGAEAHAMAEGAERLVLWTDTRFDAAHRFYEKRGYVRAGSIRILDDISKSLEFRYAKPAHGVVVEALDAAAAASAERRLAEILVACVDDGAAVSFLPPLPVETARAFWRRVSGDVAMGKRLLLVAWVDGRMAGTVQLDLDTPPNQRHRAELAKLLVHPEFRRAGTGRALMQRAEQAARGIGRTLLTLDTRAGHAGEALYRELGWREAGRIPGFATDGTGALHDTVLFFKPL
ncbi:GNAT family N-acetyltransferase [Roseomonas haemaphysalidis]|uniref:GNAT family N-acetyltransferase n=1 Tax=Roseomonas haemaphysalidis TaxID=2768162 RepID=A0ABS3KTF5_9PROT|nr:GNAT family N-acetyltransferase [Roseomonas haemaphysalidis]MBO1080760.1 GNAT family N-acetyltransferase [Roseomonas haemaphysalidis]